MHGGLLKSASAVAIIAAAGLFASPAKAADLGGDCCADLEERVAELEATTVRKGNRKVSLTISGFVSHHVVWWDDGARSDTYIADGGNYGSRWRFAGSAKINPNLTAGFLYEFQNNVNGLQGLNQTNGGDDLGNTGTAASGTGFTVLRDSTVWLRHKQLGMVKIGHGSTATDNLVLIDVAGLGGASTPDVSLYNGAMLLRNSSAPGALSGVTWNNIIVGGESWDTTRRNHVLYETPSLVGFTLQAAVAEDNYWDVALRYAGEFGGIRIAGGIGYQVNSEFNGAAGAVDCTTNCLKEETQFKGALSIMHVPTGLFLTGSAGKRDTERNDGIVGSVESSYWHLAGGISQNFFGIGKTVLYGEYGNHDDALRTFAPATWKSSEATNWGIGVGQYIDAAAMEVFIAYKNFEGSAVSNADVKSDFQDYQTIIMGTRINF